MAVKTLSPQGAITPTGPWSVGARAGDFIFVAGMRGVDKFLIWNALTKGASPRQMMLRVMLPAAMPFIFTGFRVATSFSFLLVVAAEMLNASNGLGYRILYAERTYESALMYGGFIVVATLGTGEDEQWIDALSGTYKEAFMLHYNFPPYSVGETGRMGAPGRREIGHGKLAWRAVRPLLPKQEDFPYTLRVVSEIMESNGSTSMASICGGCLALMDAGVPIIAPVAGISCGLMTEMDANGSITKWTTITDILGEEDHFGDMDFKLAGTTKGITGFQLDLKLRGIPHGIMAEAVEAARDCFGARDRSGIGSVVFAVV